MQRLRIASGSFCFILVAACSLSTAASAATLYSTGYEAPTYAEGPLDGQDGWVAPFFGVAEVTSEFSRSGSQSARFDGINEFGQRFGPFPTSEPVIVLQQAVYIDGQAEDAFLEEGFFVNPVVAFGDDATDDFIGQVPVVNGAGALGLGAQLGTRDGDFGFVPIDVGEWIVLELVLDFTSQTQEAYVDGVFIASQPFANPATELSRIELLTLNIPNHTVYLDDLAITAIPEPSSAILVGLGIAGLAGHSRRSRPRRGVTRPSA